MATEGKEKLEENVLNVCQGYNGKKEGKPIFLKYYWANIKTFPQVTITHN